jgi:hypothetical protein
MGKLGEFEHGALMAVSLLIATHGETVAAADVLNEMGLQTADCSELDDYDKANLRKVQGARGRIKLKGLEDRRPLKTRILEALTSAGGKMGYHDLMQTIWPPDLHPKAYHRSMNGGPPGVAMPLGRALRELQAERRLYASSFGDRTVALWVDRDTGEQRVTPTPAPHKRPPPMAVGA